MTLSALDEGETCWKLTASKAVGLDPAMEPKQD
jgi:hypothetical protein